MMLVFGCANIREDHYFKSYSKNAGVATNYFRLTVKANADLSSARYIAGYYDERAVDLFFNEIKSAAGTNQTNPSKLFMDNQESPGSDEVLKPLDPQQQGAFVMIFSTNAEAVANTIGNFAKAMSLQMLLRISSTKIESIMPYGMRPGYRLCSSKANRSLVS